MKSDFTEGRQGLAFKNGKLYEFTKRHVLVLSQWPDPRAWFKRRSHGWKATRKWADECFSGRVLPASREICVSDQPDELPEDIDAGQGALPGVPVSKEHAHEMWEQTIIERDHRIANAYLATTPDEVRAELLRFRDRQWHVYNLFARCPGSLDLSRSNPALLYALASNWVFHKPAVRQPIRAARSLMNKKQKVILEWLGFPATEPVRRILGKVAPYALSVRSMFLLRNLFSCPESMKLMSHLETINVEVLRLLRDPAFQRYLTPGLLAEVSQILAPPPRMRLADMGVESAVATLKDTIAMTEQLHSSVLPDPFRSLTKLREVHDEFVARINRRRVLERHHFLNKQYGNRFPVPPFCGTESIRPIETYRALEQEGSEMRHCVSIHAESVFCRREYVYKVERPVRATLSIVARQNNWVPGELSRQSNAQVDQELRRRLFDALFQSGRTVGAEAAKGYPVANAHEDRDQRVLARCELPEGEKLPLSWTENNPKQMPLLPPNDLMVYRRGLEIFGRKKAG